MKHTKKWYLNRIGKRVFRLTNVKCCNHCDNVYKNGLIVGDRQQAIYLFDCQNEMDLEYADKKLKK